MNVQEKFNRSDKVQLVPVHGFDVQAPPIANPEHSIRVRLYEDVTENELQPPRHILVFLTPQETAEMIKGLSDALQRCMRLQDFGGYKA